MTTRKPIIVHQYLDQKWIDPIWYNNGTSEIKQRQSVEHPQQDARNEVVQQDIQRDR